MKVSLDASVCSPPKCPATAEIKPTSFEVTGSGSPEVKFTPTTVSLPTISVSDLDIELKMPDITFKATDAMGGIVGALFGAQGNIIDQITGLFTNTASLETLAKLDISDMEVEVSDFSIDLGNLTVHGIRQDADHTPVSMQVDLDSLKAKADFKGIVAMLKGCLVMNGGDDCCGSKTDSPEPIKALPKIVHIPPSKESSSLKIMGENFGDVAGVVRIVTGQGINTATIDSWSVNMISATPDPVLSAGMYFAQIVTAEGLPTELKQFEIV